MVTFQPEPVARIDIPEGTVTFLFTDIEGSTRLLDRLHGQYAGLLADHHRLLRDIFARWHGREVDSQGDSFFVAFVRAGDAINAAVDAQRALAAHQWPGDARVLVRMGLHTGEPWVVSEGYVGMDVHRAARIAQAGHGGQVLLSETTTALVVDDLPDGVALRDLGCHLLKDMRRGEHIQQLVIAGLASEFPALNSISSLPALWVLPPGADGAREPRAVGPSPYRGLAAFREVDEAVFFGREAFTGQLVNAVQQRDLVAVIVGPSGSGKSSVVFAGLLPQLERANGWLVAPLRPGGRPFHALAGALMPLLDDQLSETDRLIEVEKMARALRTGELSLSLVVERILQRHSEAQRLLLVVDQFEELFTQRPNPDDQRQFLDELLAASQAVSGAWARPLVVLLTMRADFMGQALAYRPFADALQTGSLLLGPMNRSELQAVVEKPAGLRGAAFEAGLVARILDDVGEEPGNLPLLEFALSLLWEHMDHGWMTHEAYDAIGRVDGALARYAEEVYAGLPAGQQAMTQRILIQLVQPGEGTEDTRRVAGRSELGEQSWPLVQHLADRRLIVTGQDEGGHETVEVVHEALIRSWERLRGWIAADRAFRVWQEGLRASMRQWQASDHDEGALLRGAPLVAAETWLAERSGELSPAERHFIETSADLRTHEHARRERRRRLIVGGLAGGLAIALLLLAVAVSQNRIAQENAAAAEAAELDARTQASVGLASQSAREMETGLPERAVLLGLEAVENYPYTWQAERALGQAVYDNHLRHILVSGDDAVWWAPLWSPDGSRILVKVSNGAQIFDAATGKLLVAVQHDQPFGAVWSPDGARILTYGGNEAVGYHTTGGSGVIKVWDAADGKLVYELDGHEAGIMSADWSPSSDRILTASLDETAKIWDAATGKLLATFTGHQAGVASCNFLCAPGSPAWSPDEDRVVTADQAGEIYIWDPQTGAELVHLAGHTEFVNTAVWSPDGTRIASTADDATARIWDAATGRELFRYDLYGALRAYWSPEGDRVLFVSNVSNEMAVWNATTGEVLVFSGETGTASWWADWSDDGSRIVSALGGSVTVWDSVSGEVLQEFHGHTDLGGVTWSPAGDQIASAGSGTAKVWDLADELTVLEIPGDDGGRWPAAWSPDGKLVARRFEDGSIRVFDASSGEQLFATPVQDSHSSRFAFRIDFSPSGQELLVVYNDGKARIWDVSSGDMRLEVSRESEWWDGEWSPGGSRFATGSVDGVIQIWDAETGRELLNFKGHTLEINWTRWSPDGRQLLTVSADDGQAKIWDAATGELMRDLTPDGSDYRVRNAAWSPDGTHLATSSPDGSLTFWNLATGEQVQSTGGHMDTITWISWFPAQDRVLVSGWGGEIKVWDVSTGTEVASLDVPGSQSALLSPDGRQVLAMVDPDGPLVIFKVWQNLDELIDQARECCVFRDLTPEERQQFGLPPVVQVVKN